MLKRLAIASLTAGAIAIAGATGAFAGQPNQSCQTQGFTAPNGFGTDGFAHAESVYAGTELSASANHASSSHAVSQYDVACYQLSTP